jgi:hypothetical protein
MTRTFVGLFYLSGCSLAKALLKNANGTGTQELVFASAQHVFANRVLAHHGEPSNQCEEGPK